MQSNEVDYKKYLNLIERKKYLFIIVALVIMTAAVIVSYVLPRKYEAKSTVFIEKSIIGDLVKGIAVAPSIEDKIKVLTYALNSRTLVLKVLNELDLNLKSKNDAQLEELIKKFQANTDIKLKDKEGLFIITYQDEDPRIARDYVNTLVRRYIEETLSSKREESFGATSFLSDQISTFKTKMEQAEQQVNAFKREKDALFAVDPSVLSKEVSDAQQKLDEIYIKRSQLESLRNISHKQSPLQLKLQEMERRLDELQATYTDTYPEVLKVKTEIQAIKDQMASRPRTDRGGADIMEREKIDIELRALKASEEHQRRIIAQNRGLLREIPVSKSNLEALEREKDNQKLLYEQLVSRHGQSEVSKQMEVQDKSTTFRIIDPAVLPVQPVSPDRVKLILMGIAAGFAGAFGLLLLIDNLDHTVKSADTLRNLGIPVLAVVPKMLDVEKTKKNRRKSLILYLAAGVYFSAILAVLGFEAARKFL